MKSLPARTAELRANLVELAESPRHLQILDGMAESMRRSNLPTARLQIDEIARHMKLDATLCELFTMSPEMMDLIEHASKTLPPQIMTEQDLPSSHGIVHLPRRLLIPDIRGELIHVSEIMWVRVMVRDYQGRPRQAIRIIVFTRLGDPSDRLTAWIGKDTISKYLREVPEMSLVFARDLAFQDKATTITCLDEELSPSQRAKLVYEFIEAAERDTGQLAASLTELDKLPLDRGYKTVWKGHTFLTEADPFVQFLKAYFHFCKSTLTTLEREELPRSMGKWLRRLELPSGPVTVVALRKTAHQESTGHSWELTYRYVRRGHWRAQWYGSGDHKYQQYIWIAPTIVGPDDGPLRVRDVVNMVVR